MTKISVFFNPKFCESHCLTYTKCYKLLSDGSNGRTHAETWMFWGTKKCHVDKLLKSRR